MAHKSKHSKPNEPIEEHGRGAVQSNRDENVTKKKRKREENDGRSAKETKLNEEEARIINSDGKTKKTDKPLVKRPSENEAGQKETPENDLLMQLILEDVGKNQPEKKKQKRAKKNSESKEVIAAAATTESDKSPSTAFEASSSVPVASVPVLDEGAFSPELKEWVWNLTSDLRLRVGTLRGKQFVDIRHLWQGNPSKKGAFLPVHIFQRIQNWTKLQEALEKTRR